MLESKPAPARWFLRAFHVLWGAVALGVLVAWILMTFRACRDSTLQAGSGFPDPPASADLYPCHVGVRAGWKTDRWLADATVRIVGADGVERSACTAPDGWATFADVPWGPVTAKAEARGHAVVRSEQVPPDSWVEHGIVLDCDPAGSLSGRVVDAATGSPVVGALVSVLGAEGGGGFWYLEDPHTTAVTDAAGAFHAIGVAKEGSIRVRVARVEAQGCRTVWKVAPSDGEDFSFTIRMVPGGILEGTVLDADGAPVAGARVFAAPDHVWGSFGWGLWTPSRALLPWQFNDIFLYPYPSPTHAEDAWTTLATVTDAAGRYRLAGIGLGERHDVRAAAPGHAPSDVAHGVRTTRSTVPARVDLRLARRSPIVARCVDREGKPFPGLRVDVRRPGRDEHDGTTDAAGVARFEDCAPVAYEVSVAGHSSDARAETWVEAGRGEREVVLRLDSLASAPARPAPRALHPAGSRDDEAEARRRTTAFGRIAVAPGVAPPKSVRIVEESGNTMSPGREIEWRPDGDGMVPFRSTFDRPEFAIRLEAEGFLPAGVDIGPHERVPMDLGTLRLDPGWAIEGTVVLPNGTPLPFVGVEATFPPPGRPRDKSIYPHEYTRRAVSARDGTFRIRGLPGRIIEMTGPTVALSMEDDRFLPYRDEITPTEPTTPLRLVVRPGGSLTVRVADEDGNPVARARVVAEAAPTKIHGETDSDGTCPLRFPAGTYLVSVRRPATDETAAPVTTEVTLADGETREVRLAFPPP